MAQGQEYDVVLIDADAAYVKKFRHYCNRHKKKALILQDPKEALSKSFGSRPPIVIVDLNMRDVFGIRWKFAAVVTILELRRRFGRKFPLWVMTRSGNPNVISQCLKVGANDFVWKGAPMRDLVARL